MRKMDSESIDLIYLDPPFFSNRNYEVIWGDKGEVRSFEDRWSGGIDHYIAWLKERVTEMHRLLKPTGSIYLHCDWHANSYIRVFILDKIFGESNFKTEIIWKRTSAHSNNKIMGNLHDMIYYYTKSNSYHYNVQYQAYDNDYVETYYRYTDEKTGKKFLSDNLVGHKGVNKEFEWKGITRPWRYPKHRLDELEEQGRIFWTKNKYPRFKRFLEDMPGVPLQSIWSDIKHIGSWSKEGIGYPTQKPEKLLERIILASSNEGDIVFDPFVGGGTTIAVADRLNRRWLGIDQSVQAVKVSEMRIEKQQNLFSAPFTLQLHKYDFDTLRYKDAFEFEKWIIERYDGIVNTKQRGDLGLDGKKRDGTPIQVKRSDNIGRNVIDNFLSAIKRSDKSLFDKNKTDGNPIGYIIAFSFGSGARQEVARLKNQEDIIIKLVQVDEIVPIAKKPKLQVAVADIGADSKGLREIQFTATAESDSGIEFYAFDFDYKPNERKFNANDMLNKDGKATHKFKPGKYTIAIKAVDNEGLEALEEISIKVNGKVTQL
jgi:DNA modification methylase